MVSSCIYCHSKVNLVGRERHEVCQDLQELTTLCVMHSLIRMQFVTRDNPSTSIMVYNQTSI